MVCVVSGVGGVNWTIAVNVFRLQIFCRQQSSVVENLIHTAEADTTETGLFCRVSPGVTLRKNEERHLDAFEMKGLRKIVRVSWTAKKQMSGFLTKLE